MAESIKDGGRAFPVHPGSNPDGGSAGMSLRDWFAGQALSGLISNSVAVASLTLPGMSQQEADKSFAGISYGLADAMLAAREAR